jgi:hypothetical protein
MRRTLIALLAATAMVGACQQQADEPADAPAAGPSVSAPEPEMPADAPPQEEVDPAVVADASAPCSTTLDAAAAARLVERCIAVSPATRPPCNVANPCAMIQGEIDRSCGQYGPGEAKPAECAA